MSIRNVFLSAVTNGETVRIPPVILETPGLASLHLLHFAVVQGSESPSPL